MIKRNLLALSLLIASPLTHAEGTDPLDKASAIIKTAETVVKVTQAHIKLQKEYGMVNTLLAELTMAGSLGTVAGFILSINEANMNLGKRILMSLRYGTYGVGMGTGLLLPLSAIIELTQKKTTKASA